MGSTRILVPPLAWWALEGTWGPPLALSSQADPACSPWTDKLVAVPEQSPGLSCCEGRTQPGRDLTGASWGELAKPLEAGRMAAAESGPCHRGDPGQGGALALGGRPQLQSSPSSHNPAAAPKPACAQEPPGEGQQGHTAQGLWPRSASGRPSSYAGAGQAGVVLGRNP